MRAVFRATFFLFVAAAGAVRAQAAPAADKIRIMATVFPLAEFASAIAGDRGETSLLLPPGAGVHTWQPRPGDIARLSECDLLLYIGSGLEPWLPDLLKAFPPGRIRTLEAAAGLAVAGAPEEEHAEEHGHGPLDPHVWLDFGLDEVIADRIVAALTAVEPAAASEFAGNAARLKDRLRSLDGQFRAGLAGCRGRTIVLAGHAAFGYLARRYGLGQTSLYGLSPDAQPKPQDLIRAIEFCKANGVRTVFTESSVPPDLSKTLAREIGGRVLALYAGHNLTRDEQDRRTSFFALMEEDLARLRDGLGCR